MKALNSYVIMKPLPIQSKVGSIEIPEQMVPEHGWATVVSVGEGYRRTNGTLFPMKVREGDLVFTYNSNHRKLPDGLTWCHQLDVLAVVVDGHVEPASDFWMVEEETPPEKPVHDPSERCRYRLTSGPHKGSIAFVDPMAVYRIPVTQIAGGDPIRMVRPVDVIAISEGVENGN